MYGSADTVNRMKTTIELPDALAAEAREVARAQSTTLRDLVVSGLQHEVKRRTSTTQRTDFVFPTAGGTGLLVDPGDAIRIAYGDLA